MAKKKSKKISTPIKKQEFEAKAWTTLLLWLVMIVGAVMAFGLTSGFHKQKLVIDDKTEIDEVTRLVEMGIQENLFSESRSLWNWWNQIKGGNQPATPLLYPEDELYGQLMKIDESLQIQPTAKGLLLRKMALLNKLNRDVEAELILKELEKLDPNDFWILNYQIDREE